MYLQNKYSKCYFNIIERARARELEKPYEVHHIVPRSIGGSNDSNNLVKLTPREHFIVHWLLTKMLSNSPEQKKMFHAFSAFAMISSNQNRKINSRHYQLLSQASKLALKGNTHNKGKKRTAEANKKQSQTMKQKYSLGNHPLKGLSYEEKYGEVETQLRRDKLKGPRGPRLVKRIMPTSECPHCGKIAATGLMQRWHFSNCKMI